MRRNCNLNNLQILPYSIAPSSSSSSFCYQLVCCSDQNQINIFYNDATELQAIAVLLHARREMEEKYKVNDRSSSAPLLLQLHGIIRGLSLKKSLQKFLQKRKDRIQASMPY